LEKVKSSESCKIDELIPGVNFEGGGDAILEIWRGKNGNNKLIFLYKNMEK